MHPPCAWEVVWNNQKIKFVGEGMSGHHKGQDQSNNRLTPVNEK